MIDSITIALDDSRFVPAMPAEGSDEYDDLLDKVDEALQMAADAVAQHLATQFPQFVVLLDGEPKFFVGHADPTPTAKSENAYCDEIYVAHNEPTYRCTWPKNHGSYPHVAGNGDRICAVWS